MMILKEKFGTACGKKKKKGCGKRIKALKTLELGTVQK